MMRVFNGFDSLPQFIHPVVTVGSFDGVHLGHRAIIERVLLEARSRGGESIVLTFEPHPRITLGRAEGLRLLTGLDEKIELLTQLGVDNVIVIPFNRTYSALSGEEFVQQYLLDKVGAEVLVAGYNHRFGHDRIRATAIHAQGLKTVQVEECDLTGRRISSTIIRQLLDKGETAEAERLLGHPLNNESKTE